MFWFFSHKAYGSLASRPEIKYSPPALEGEVLTTGPSETSLLSVYFTIKGFKKKKLNKNNWINLLKKEKKK